VSPPSGGHKSADVHSRRRPSDRRHWRRQRNPRAGADDAIGHMRTSPRSSPSHRRAPRHAETHAALVAVSTTPRTASRRQARAEVALDTASRAAAASTRTSPSGSRDAGKHGTASHCRSASHHHRRHPERVQIEPTRCPFARARCRGTRRDRRLDDCGLEPESRTIEDARVTCGSVEGDRIGERIAVEVTPIGLRVSETRLFVQPSEQSPTTSPMVDTVRANSQTRWLLKNQRI